MKIATRENFLTALLRVLPGEAGIAVIHSSLPDLVPPEEFSPWDALYALEQIVRQGWTVALPAFTFSFCSGTSYDAKRSASETGMLADALLKYFPQALRTPHPIYSFAVLGPRAMEIAKCPSTTTFGDDSPFGLFERERAAVVMLGCSWAFNTQFHRYEEISNVPYRFSKAFTGTADFGSGPCPTRATMWVRDLAANPINDFSPAVRKLRDAGLIFSSPIWRGRIEAAGAHDIARICRADLSLDPFAYLANAEQVSTFLAQREEATAQPPLRIATLASFNLHILEQAWQAQLAELVPERRIDHYSIPFGQMHPSIVNPTSDLRTFLPNVRVFCDRLEDVTGEVSSNIDQMAILVREYAESVALFHKSVPGWSIVHRFAVMVPAANNDTLRASAVQVIQMNEILENVLGQLPQIAWVDLAAEAAVHEGPALDPRLWHIGRIAFTQSFSQRLGRRWAALTLAMLGKTARVVVVDLDNTLWGGVLGEEGLSGVKIGGDYPGSAYAAFQRALKSLPQRGVVLAITSKNDEDMALRAIDELPSMVLRSADFSARRINWLPKSQNIRDIAAELNLGMDSVLFVDDNPVEREEVRRNLPRVKVLNLPSDPALYVDALLASPHLTSVSLTLEDHARADYFKTQRLREAERTRSASLEDYYAGLGTVLHLSPLNEGNAQRAAQLCQKTNQFNTTTRRYDLLDLQRLAENGADVVVVGLTDRHTPAENIGLIVLVPEDETSGSVDLYLLSCRVLGRGIETAIPRWAISRAAQRGWSALRGEIINTERNTPVRNVFSDAGFDPAGPRTWIARTEVRPALPPWLTISDLVTSR